MSDPLKLPSVGGDLAEGLSAIREALSDQLLGKKPDRPFVFTVEEDDGAFGAPGWTDGNTGHVHLARSTAEALPDDPDAVLAVALQLMHSIGAPPACVDLEGQLLEEAIAEILAQLYDQPIGEALGAEPYDLEPEYLFKAQPEDIELAQPVVAAASVERFARLAVWLEELDDPALDGDDIEAATLKWAIRMKATPTAERFAALAQSAAALDMTEGAEEWHQVATQYLERYLRGYMGQLVRSTTGFGALRAASAKAWGDSDVPSAPVLEIPFGDDSWKAQLVNAQRVILSPGSNDRAITEALERFGRASGFASQLRRSLDARALLWAARMQHIAELGAVGVAPSPIK